MVTEGRSELERKRMELAEAYEKLMEHEESGDFDPRSNWSKGAQTVGYVIRMRDEYVRLAFESGLPTSRVLFDRNLLRIDGYLAGQARRYQHDGDRSDYYAQGAFMAATAAELPANAITPDDGLR